MLKVRIGASVKYRVVKRRVGEQKPYAIDESLHNCFLVEGMNYMWRLILGESGLTPFNSSNACIGVGDGTTAESETQTGLQGSNKFYKGMASGYPKGPADVGDRKAVFRSVFVNGEAEFAWNEVTVANGNGDSAVNMLRVVASKGTKPSGEEWTAEVEVAFQNPT